jgi:hypothetical protein
LVGEADGSVGALLDGLDVGSEVGAVLGPGAEVSGLSGLSGVGDLVTVGSSRVGDNDLVMLGTSIAPLLPAPPHATRNESRRTPSRTDRRVRRSMT